MFKKALKTIATVGMSASLLFGATFGISACGSNENTHDNPSISTPVDPEKPDDKTPSKPENPTNPDTPTNPENPTNPTTPENPTNPDKPTDPENPGENDPNKKPDEQKPEEPVFKLNATTKAKIEEKLKPTMENLVYCYNKSSTYYDLLQAYLRKSESAKFVDTLGCVMKINNGNGLLYSEIAILNPVEDLTWEKICQNGIGLDKYTTRTCARRSLYSTQNSISGIQNYDFTYVDDAFKKAFNINDQAFNSALFTGWTYEEGILDAAHYLTYINNNMIYQKVLDVKKNGNGMFNAFIENYLNAKDDSKWFLYKESEDTLIKNVKMDTVVDFGTKESQAEIQ